jgi:hypothetical protein
MKEIILEVLDELKDSQLNISSESARLMLANKLHEELDKYVVNVLESAIIGE